MNTRLIFETKVCNLKSLGDDRFIIPSYQRPYVWDDLQVRKLLSDFYNAFKADRNSHYFLGTVVCSPKNGKYEIIDGQQRFTTIWLIALAFKHLKIESNLVNFLEVPNSAKEPGKSEKLLRLDFAIRVNVIQYFTNLLGGTSNITQDTEDEYLRMLKRAQATIQGIIIGYNSEKADLVAFGNYIFKRVFITKNIAPENTDLNKLFAALNNSGIQLEQSDILKSKLLQKITNRKLMYGKIWEACENMDNYFEKNVLDVFPITSRVGLTTDSFASFNPEIFKYSEVETPEIMQGVGNYLEDILDSAELSGVINGSTDLGKSENIPEEPNDDRITSCESILNFSQLLLHTLRVYLKNENQEDFDKAFHIKHLLEIFNNVFKDDTDEDKIKTFLNCLWKTRYIFDMHVVKWVVLPQTGERELKIADLSKSEQNGKSYFSRAIPERNNGQTMLQSVLYFTGNYNTHIWLSPYLKNLLEVEESLGLLESIDNKLSISLGEDKSVTWSLMDREFTVKDDKINLAETLNKAKGTGFQHYWFQKLEYILWKKYIEVGMPVNENFTRTSGKTYMDGFRITSKNSVEHVFPQNPENNVELEYDTLHSFGNLALLSVSQNSTYGRQDTRKKMVDFYMKPTFDSLKLAKLFAGLSFEAVRPEQLYVHRDEMIGLILDHYEEQHSPKTTRD